MEVNMHDSVKDHDERTEDILKGYTWGIVMMIAGAVLLYYGVGLGIHLLWLGAVILDLNEMYNSKEKKSKTEREVVVKGGGLVK